MCSSRITSETSFLKVRQQPLHARPLVAHGGAEIALGLDVAVATEPIGAFMSAWICIWVKGRS